MDLWSTLGYAAWGLSFLFGLYIVVDWLRTDATYSDDVLLSSREGELEAITEGHKVPGGEDV